MSAACLSHQRPLGGRRGCGARRHPEPSSISWSSQPPLVRSARFLMVWGQRVKPSFLGGESPLVETLPGPPRPPWASTPPPVALLSCAQRCRPHEGLGSGWARPTRRHRGAWGGGGLPPERLPSEPRPHPPCVWAPAAPTLPPHVADLSYFLWLPCLPLVPPSFLCPLPADSGQRRALRRCAFLRRCWAGVLLQRLLGAQTVPMGDSLTGGEPVSCVLGTAS